MRSRRIDPEVILEGLNKRQREAVKHTEGPLLVVAGPGTGKTTVLIRRTAYLMGVNEVNPRNILAITFTNKAANELEERTRKFVGDKADKAVIGTFHATCAKILHHEGKHVGLYPGYVIYGEDEQIGVVRRCLEDLSISTERFPPYDVHQAISSWKNRGIHPQDVIPSGYGEETIAKVYVKYQEKLLSLHSTDFDNLLLYVVQVFREHPKVLEKYQGLYRYIMVDEFQDTNVVQSQLIEQLGREHRNVCVVGDADQAIYSFRHADIRNILDFQTNYPEAHRVDLEQNYRSTKTILGAARAVVVKNKDRLDNIVWTDNEAGEKLVLLRPEDESEEARTIAGEVLRQVSDGNEVALKDCVVAYRTNAQSRELEAACISGKIPYQIIGGIRFYDRREIQDVVAYLRVISNLKDDMSLLRILNVPPRGIGNVAKAKLMEVAKERGVSLWDAVCLYGTASPITSATRPVNSFYEVMGGLINLSMEVSVPELIQKVLDEVKYQKFVMGMTNADDRWNNIMELMSLAEGTKDLGELLERVALESNVDRIKDGNVLTLITLHQAKGLEYKVVFIAGTEDGLLPHYRSRGDRGQYEEERRLCYVGMTRAKKRLYLSAAYRRALSGRLSQNPISPFVEDIPKEMIDAR
jgi:DNA helicase-2/ATP-dependent DNA helicase PcrA